MAITLQEWEKKHGLSFLRKVGLKKNDIVLDFGARVGHYSIPAASLVGPQGKIYALDKNSDSLGELKDKTDKKSISNLETIKTDGSISLEFTDSFFDAILVYDVLHYFNLEQINKLFSEFSRVIKPQALLSVYPKHIEKEDYTLPQIIEILEKNNFSQIEKICDNIPHYNSINYDCVYNFILQKKGEVS